MVSVKVIFGDARYMKELQNSSVHLVVTSPPYYNAPYDFPDLFRSYREFLDLIRDVGKEVYRVLKPGRVACYVLQDVRIDGELYPITADTIKVMQEVGFKYQERIVWKKPNSYIKISRRSGNIIQHPYPMYFYPDNVFEEIVVFRKPGSFIPPVAVEDSKIDITRFQREKWYLTIWEITNVLPQDIWSKYTAAFPEELVERLIRLYSYKGETVLDPFLGTGTTCAVARALERNSVGYEIDLELMEAVKMRIPQNTLTGDVVEICVREDTKKLRTKLREKIEKNLKKSALR